MNIPARIIRAQVEDLPGIRHRLTEKEREREERIITTATAVLARNGRAGFNMGNFALALRMAPITLRRHFPDADALLAEILYRHLAAIAAAIGEPVRRGAANPKAARREAYIAYTRNGFGAPTERHHLLLRERHSLPQDLLGPIEDLRFQIGDMLAGPHAEAALALLDTPTLQPQEIEDMLAALAPKPVQTPPPNPGRVVNLSEAADRKSTSPPDAANFSFAPTTSGAYSPSSESRPSPRHPGQAPLPPHFFSQARTQDHAWTSTSSPPDRLLATRWTNSPSASTC